MLDGSRLCLSFDRDLKKCDMENCLDKLCPKDTT